MAIVKGTDVPEPVAQLPKPETATTAAKADTAAAAAAAVSPAPKAILGQFPAGYVPKTPQQIAAYKKAVQLQEMLDANNVALAAIKKRQDDATSAAEIATLQSEADKATADAKTVSDAADAAVKDVKATIGSTETSQTVDKTTTGTADTTLATKIATETLDANNGAAAAATNINKASDVPVPATGTITPDTAAADYAKAQAALEKENARQSAITVMQARFQQYNLGSLADKIKQLTIDGATDATITLQLQETPEYQKRFSANTIRIKNNLQTLSPADYLNLEDGYRQILKSYGLPQLATDDYVSKYIAADTSVTELTNRVSTAVQRVLQADPSVSSTFRDFFNIGQGDLVAYVLDPEGQLPKIERQVQAAEIGAAAKAQGLDTSATTAEQLASQGITQAQAKTGYSTIGDILPTAEKLSAIYGENGTPYGQTQAEQEVFGGLASAKRAREKLTATEIAQFSGSSGAAKGAFSTGYLNKQSTAGQF